MRFKKLMIVAATAAAGTIGLPVTTLAAEQLFKQVSSVKVKGQNLRPIRVTKPGYPESLVDTRVDGEAT